MKKSINLLFLIIMSLKVVAQMQEKNTPLPSQEAIKNFELKEGVFESSLEMTDLSKWKMMFSIPKLTEGRKVNVVLALHWGVGSTGYDDFMKCLILPSFDQDNYLIIAPYAERQAWWVVPKKDQLVSLIKSMKKYWPVGKVIVTGYSDGGTGSIHMAKYAPNEFDAAIGIAGSYTSTKKFNIPTYAIHGRGDQLFDYNRAKRIIEAAKESSENVEFVTSEELTHYDACDYVPYLKEAIKWVEQKIN